MLVAIFLNLSNLYIVYFFCNFNVAKFRDMVIERIKKEVIIRLPGNVDTTGLQKLIDYLTYKEETVNSKAKQLDVDNLAKEVKEGWWAKN